MKLQRLALAMAGVGMLAATAMSAPASAGGSADPKPSWSEKAQAMLKQQSMKKSSSAAAAGCIQWVGWPTAAATAESADVTPHTPPSAVPYEPINFVATRANATWYLAQNASGSQIYFYGLLLQGTNLYRHTTYVPESSAPVATFKKVGQGWGSFKSITTSNYSITVPRHAYLYGLNTNGSVYRYAIVGSGFKAMGSFAGFKGFRAMAVVSETATYDTLLMTTTAGALYTIRIPVTATAKPVVKLVRSTGFKDYDSLAVQACGTRGGSLVVGVNSASGVGDQYAFGHMTGTTTAMTKYGKVPVAFTGVNSVAFTTHYDQLNGE